jgi:hypothetical protein
MFIDAQLKIERAKEHIKNFLLRINQINEAQGHNVRVYRKTNTGYDALEFIPCEAVSPELMCIVGDAVHNLRSALDVAMSDIEFATTGKRTDKVIFPSRKTRDQLKVAVDRRLKGKAPERIIDYIVESIQPYERGNGDAIWQLHSLDIVDKHRLIIPKLQFEWVRNIRYIDETGEEFTVPEWVITNARRVFYPTEKRGVQVTHKGHSSVSILFGKGMPFESKHVFPTLSKLAPAVVRTLLALEGEFSESQGNG